MSAFIKGYNKDSHLCFNIQKAVTWEGIVCYQVARSDTEAVVANGSDEGFDIENIKWKSKKIPISDYQKISDLFDKIDFFNLMQEMAGHSGFDGETYTCELGCIYSDSHFKIDIWCPFKNKDFPETTKFLEAFEAVEKLYNETKN